MRAEVDCPTASSADEWYSLSNRSAKPLVDNLLPLSEVARDLGRRTNLDPAAGGHITIDRAGDGNRCRANLGSHHGIFANSDIVRGRDFTFELSVDPGRPVEIQLSSDSAAPAQIVAVLDRKCTGLT